MPVYNAAPYLRDAIDSILKQTFMNFEFIIINDGSTDTSEEIIRTYKDPRIRHVSHDQNLGLIASLNKGLELARGEYIARMDADDISLPERLSKQVALLDHTPEIGACGSAYRYIGSRSYTAYLPTSCAHAFTMLSTNSSLGHPTALIRKSVLNKHRIRYETDYPYAEDFVLWIRLAQVSCLMSLAEPLLLYRWHSANLSQAAARQAQARAKARILWHELLLGQPVTEAQRSYLKGDFHSRSVFGAGRKLILSTLASQTHLPLDKAYYGQLAVTEWELGLIDRFGLRGLLTSLLAIRLHKWSSATSIGLVAHYLSRFSIKFRQKGF